MEQKLKCGECKEELKGNHTSEICGNCKCLNITETIKSHTLKEWLNFNFQDYLRQIFSVIDTHDFNEIKAQTQDEIKAGRFTDIEVERLRGVLNDGFTNEKTIIEIADDINKKVKPRDLLRMQDGKLQLKDGKTIIRFKSETRGILLARTETTRIANLGAIEHFKSQGVREYTWVTSLGTRTCPVCENLDGQIFVIGAGPVPPDPHPMCRCTVINLTG